MIIWHVGICKFLFSIIPVIQHLVSSFIERFIYLVKAFACVIDVFYALVISIYISLCSLTGRFIIEGFFDLLPFFLLKEKISELRNIFISRLFIKFKHFPASSRQ